MTDFVWTSNSESLVDVDTPENRARIPQCVDRGDIANMEVLLAKGVDPNVRTSTGTTALISAIHKRNMDCLILLLGAPKLDWDLADEFGQTPLIAACKTKPDDAIDESILTVIIKLLLDHKGLKVDANDASGISALLYAVARRDMKLVKLLIEDGHANIEQANRAGVTPLMTAAMNGDEAMCFYLMERGADIEETDLHGRTAAGLVEPGQLKAMLTGIKTSFTKPYIPQYIECQRFQKGARGKFAFLRPPGGASEKHSRSIQRDFEALHKAGCNVFVTLLPKDQLANLNISDALLTEYCRKWNIEWVHLPLESPAAIAGDDWLKYSDLINDWLVEGKHVVMHCDFSRDRCACMAACLLIRFRMSDEQAIAVVREVKAKFCDTFSVTPKLFLASFLKKYLQREKKEKEEFVKRIETPSSSLASSSPSTGSKSLRDSGKKAEIRDATFIV